MRSPWLFDPMPAWLWRDSPIWPATFLFVSGAGFWFGCERVICGLELWPQPCLELVGRSRGVGLGVWMRVEPIFRDAFFPHLLGVFVVRVVGTTKCAEPVARERLLRPNLADLGAGSIHPF